MAAMFGVKKYSAAKGAGGDTPMSGLQILGYSHSPIFLYECEDHQSLSLRGYHLDCTRWKKSTRVPIGYQGRGVGQQNSQTSLFLFWYSTCILYLSLRLRASVKFGVIGTKRTVHSSEVSILWTETGLLRSLVSVLVWCLKEQGNCSKCRSVCVMELCARIKLMKSGV